MLPLKHRLSLRTEKEFYKTFRKHHFPKWLFFVDTLTAIGTTANPSQAAVIVPKKVALLATERNTIKRLLRSSISPLLACSQNKKLVISAKQKITKQDIPQLIKDLQKVL